MDRTNLTKRPGRYQQPSLWSTLAIWWFRLTSSPQVVQAVRRGEREAYERRRDPTMAPLEAEFAARRLESERIRRGRLIAVLIFVLALADLGLFVSGIGDVGTMLAAAGAALGLVVAATLNRRGGRWALAAAGSILVVIVTAAVMSALFVEPNGELLLDALPAYDVLGIGVLVAASVLPRAGCFVVAAINSGLIVLDFLVQPHAPDVERDLRLNFPSPTDGILAFLLRPIVIQIVIAGIAYLWVRGTDAAQQRADAAEDQERIMRAAQAQIQAYAARIEEGANVVVAPIYRFLRGEHEVQVNLRALHGNPLFDFATRINQLLQQLRRTAQRAQAYDRVERDALMVAAAIEAPSDERPSLPPPTGTALDPITVAVARLRRIPWSSAPAPHASQPPHSPLPWYAGSTPSDAGNSAPSWAPPPPTW